MHAQNKLIYELGLEIGESMSVHEKSEKVIELLNIGYAIEKWCSIAK